MESVIISISQNNLEYNLEKITLEKNIIKINQSKSVCLSVQVGQYGEEVVVLSVEGNRCHVE